MSKPNPESPKINLAGFFDEGFRKDDDWLAATKISLPAKLKYLSHEEMTGQYGVTMRYNFKNEQGENVRLLCAGSTFKAAIEKYCPIGTTILLYRDEDKQNRPWMFDLA